MNDDLEPRLRALRLAEPSAEHDRRMTELFANFAATPNARPGWWLALVAPLAGVAAALAMFTLPGERYAPPEPLLYRIEPEGLMRELLMPPSRAPVPVFEATVSTANPLP